MKLRYYPILLSLLVAPVFADTFGSGANTFTMDFVTIGNPGNADDDTGYGSVGYTYKMGVNEVSERMINAYNALSGGPTITKNTLGPDRPATGITWNEAARFVNWLNTSKGYSAAYKFTTGGYNDAITLWTNADAGYNAANPFRNANAYYFLPSEDEWYKAAYYDPNKSGGAGYWNFATGSDSAPTAVTGGTASGTAVYNNKTGGTADVTNAGGLSPYGTMAQSGNVAEWNESAEDGSNNLASENRVIRGGAFWNSAGVGSELLSEFRDYSNPSAGGEMQYYANDDIGFRVAAIPEPTAFLLTLLGALGVVIRRKR